jgi:hypothetical protein
MGESPTEGLDARPPEPAAHREGLTRRQRAKVGVAGLLGWLGIFGIGAAVGAIMGWQDVRGWVVGLVVAGVTVLLSFILRRSLPTG